MLISTPSNSFLSFPEAEVDLMEELLDSAENFDDELNDVADDKASKCVLTLFWNAKLFIHGDCIILID